LVSSKKLNPYRAGKHHDKLTSELLQQDKQCQRLFLGADDDSPLAQLWSQAVPEPATSVGRLRRSTTENLCAPLILGARSEQKRRKELQAADFGGVAIQSRRHDQLHEARRGDSIALLATSEAALLTDF
jgi:hypothetical protein